MNLRCAVLVVVLFVLGGTGAGVAGPPPPLGNWQGRVGTITYTLSLRGDGTYQMGYLNNATGIKKVARGRWTVERDVIEFKAESAPPGTSRREHDRFRMADRRTLWMENLIGTPPVKFMRTL